MGPMSLHCSYTPDSLFFLSSTTPVLLSTTTTLREAKRGVLRRRGVGTTKARWSPALMLRNQVMKPESRQDHTLSYPTVQLKKVYLVVVTMKTHVESVTAPTSTGATETAIGSTKSAPTKRRMVLRKRC